MNRQSYTLITAPATEPVQLSDVRTFLRVDGSSDDALLVSLIVSARRMCEELTKRSFLAQTWKLTLDRFEERVCRTEEGFSIGPTPEGHGQAIQLSRQPVQSITSIVSYCASNTALTVDVSVYRLDPAGGRIVLKDGKAWPSDLRSEGGAEITFVAGYTNVPEDIRQAIMQTVAAMYQSKACFDVPAGAKALLAPYMLPEAYGLM